MQKSARLIELDTKSFTLEKRDVLSVPLDIMLSLHIHLQSMMGLFLEKTGDKIAVLNTNRLLSEERESFFFCLAGIR